MAEGRPYLAAAFLCERVLEDKDRVLSAIRIVDTFVVPQQAGTIPADIRPGFSFTVLLSFKRSEGDSSNKHQATVRIHTPSGKPLKIEGRDLPEPTFAFVFEPTPEGHGVGKRDS